MTKKKKVSYEKAVEAFEKQSDDPTVECTNCGEKRPLSECCHTEKLTDNSFVGFCSEGCYGEHREYEYKARRRMEEQKRKEQIDEVVESLSNIVNVMGTDRENAALFFDCFLRKHRTLQASMVRLMITFLSQYGELEESWYDARNEGAVKACKKLLSRELVGSTHIPYI